MTVKVQGKTFDFSENKAREVMKQLFGQYFDVRKNLEDRGIEADNKMVDFIEKNLFDEVMTDNEFWDSLDRSIFWLSDRFGAKKND